MTVPSMPNGRLRRWVASLVVALAMQPMPTLAQATADQSKPLKTLSIEELIDVDVSLPPARTRLADPRVDGLRGTAVAGARAGRRVRRVSVEAGGADRRGAHGAGAPPAERRPPDESQQKERLKNGRKRSRQEAAFSTASSACSAVTYASSACAKAFM